MNLDLAGGNTQGPTSWKRPFPSGKRGIKLGKEKKKSLRFHTDTHAYNFTRTYRYTDAQTGLDTLARRCEDRPESISRKIQIIFSINLSIGIHR